MNMAAPTTLKTNKDLRKFGITVSIPLLLIGSYLWWKDSGASLYLLSAGGALLVLGLLAPSTLKYVEIAWMKFAAVMSFIMTRVILTIAFVFVITPFGILLRLMGKDLLELKIDKTRASYWSPVEPDGPQTRPDKPF
jgi:Saxitoxin biosynthesis operon protein SxtJ